MKNARKNSIKSSYSPIRRLKQLHGLTHVSTQASLVPTRLKAGHFNKKEELNNSDKDIFGMVKIDKTIGLGVVGGILMSVGIFVFKNWINSPQILINKDPIVGIILMAIGIGSILYARYGNYN